MITASQMMAQKRAQKHAKQAKAQAKNVLVGNPKKVTTNPLVNCLIANQQNKNLVNMAITIGTNLYSPELIEKDYAKSIAAYDNLIYGRDLLVTIDYFEHIASMVHLFGELRNRIPTEHKTYDPLWRDHANAAIACFTPYSGSWGDSPNQRRQYFAPVWRMIGAMHALHKVLPCDIGRYFSEYATAASMAKNMVKLFTRHNPKVVDSLFQIMKGSSLRQSAKFHGIKEPQLREEVIFASVDLWRVANCYERLPVARSIPELRQKAWQPYADESFIQKIVKQSADEILIPFEQYTGITLIDHKKFVRDLIKIEKRF